MKQISRIKKNKKKDTSHEKFKNIFGVIKKQINSNDFSSLVKGGALENALKKLYQNPHFGHDSSFGKCFAEVCDYLVQKLVEKISKDSELPQKFEYLTKLYDFSIQTRMDQIELLQKRFGKNEEMTEFLIDSLEYLSFLNANSLVIKSCFGYLAFYHAIPTLAIIIKRLSVAECLVNTSETNWQMKYSNRSKTFNQDKNYLDDTLCLCKAINHVKKEHLSLISYYLDANDVVYNADEYLGKIKNYIKIWEDRLKILKQNTDIKISAEITEILMPLDSLETMRNLNPLQQIKELLPLAKTALFAIEEVPQNKSDELERLFRKSIQTSIGKYLIEADSTQILVESYILVIYFNLISCDFNILKDLVAYHQLITTVYEKHFPNNKLDLITRQMKFLLTYVDDIEKFSEAPIKMVIRWIEMWKIKLLFLTLNNNSPDPILLDNLPVTLLAGLLKQHKNIFLKTHIELLLNSLKKILKQAQENKNVSWLEKYNITSAVLAVLQTCAEEQLSSGDFSKIDMLISIFNQVQQFFPDQSLHHETQIANEAIKKLSNAKKDQKFELLIQKFQQQKKERRRLLKINKIKTPQHLKWPTKKKVPLQPEITHNIKKEKNNRQIEMIKYENIDQQISKYKKIKNKQEPSCKKLYKNINQLIDEERLKLQEFLPAQAKFGTNLLERYKISLEMAQCQFAIMKLLETAIDLSPKNQNFKLKLILLKDFCQQAKKLQQQVLNTQLDLHTLKKEVLSLADKYQFLQENNTTPLKITIEKDIKYYQELYKKVQVDQLQDAIDVIEDVTTFTKEEKIQILDHALYTIKKNSFFSQALKEELTKLVQTKIKNISEESILELPQQQICSIRESQVCSLIKESDISQPPLLKLEIPLVHESVIEKQSTAQQILPIEQESGTEEKISTQSLIRPSFFKIDGLSSNREYIQELTQKFFNSQEKHQLIPTFESFRDCLWDIKNILNDTHTKILVTTQYFHLCALQLFLEVYLNDSGQIQTAEKLIQQIIPQNKEAYNCISHKERSHILALLQYATDYQQIANGLADAICDELEIKIESNSKVSHYSICTYFSGLSALAVTKDSIHCDALCRHLSFMDQYKYIIFNSWPLMRRFEQVRLLCFAYQTLSDVLDYVLHPRELNKQLTLSDVKNLNEYIPSFYFFLADFSEQCDFKRAIPEQNIRLEWYVSCRKRELQDSLFYQGGVELSSYQDTKPNEIIDLKLVLN